MITTIGIRFSMPPSLSSAPPTTDEANEAKRHGEQEDRPNDQE
jgi:hypothetical protein